MKIEAFEEAFPHATVDVKLFACKTLVRQVLEYDCVVWDPFRQNHVQRLETTQKTVARYILARYRRNDSVSQMLYDLGLESLKEGKLLG